MPTFNLTVYDPYMPELKVLKLCGSYKEWDANVLTLIKQLRTRPNATKCCFVHRKTGDDRYMDMTLLDGRGYPVSGAVNMADACLSGLFKVATPEEEEAAQLRAKKHRLEKLKRHGALAAAREAQLDLGRKELATSIQKAEAELFSDPSAKPAGAGANPPAD